MHLEVAPVIRGLQFWQPFNRHRCILSKICALLFTLLTLSRAVWATHKCKKLPCHSPDLTLVFENDLKFWQCTERFWQCQKLNEEHFASHFFNEWVAPVIRKMKMLCYLFICAPLNKYEWTSSISFNFHPQIIVLSETRKERCQSYDNDYMAKNMIVKQIYFNVLRGKLVWKVKVN